MGTTPPKKDKLLACNQLGGRSYNYNMQSCDVYFEICTYMHMYTYKLLKLFHYELFGKNFIDKNKGWWVDFIFSLTHLFELYPTIL